MVVGLLQQELPRVEGSLQWLSQTSLRAAEARGWQQSVIRFARKTPQLLPSHRACLPADITTGLGWL